MRRDISLTLPLSRAVEHVKRLLFQRFDPAKWFVIGFCAWLARLGEGGFQFGYRNNSSFGRAATLPNFQHWFEQGRSYVLVNLAWIVPLAATIVVAALAIWIVILCLNSRG